MIKKNPLPDQRRLLEFFSYDAESGELRWRQKKARALAGDLVKLKNASGHLVVNFDGISYLAHRIIWKMVTGADPIDEIDHINGAGSDNTWMNLRECNRHQNMANARVPVTNVSGVKCVNFHSGHGKWHAKIRRDNVEHHIGYFSSLEDAKEAVAKARARLHGEFARAV